MYNRPITIGIPTKNRQKQIFELLNSLSNQSFTNFKILIVDQSKNSIISLIEKTYSNKINFIDHIEYIHIPSITSLTMAKNFIVDRNESEFLCFLEDDEVLDTNFIKNLYLGFDDKNMIGSSGVIVNFPKMSLVYKFVFNFFHIGIYKDIRLRIFSDLKNSKQKLYLSNKISGGMSMWRSFIFNEFRFDETSNIHFTEDIDFSTRVDKKYPKSLYINTKAKLFHNIDQNQISRLTKYDLIEKKIKEYKIFYKKRKCFINLFCSLWLFLGFFLESIVESLKNRSFNALISFCKGLFC